MLHSGLRSVCIREHQKSLKESAKKLIEDKLAKFGLGEADGFKVFKEVIETPGDGIIIFQGMKDHTAESIKSLEGFGRAWVEEAQTLSKDSLKLLRPTIRAEGSEIWFSWNPRREEDPVDKLLRSDETPTDAIVIKADYSDNPWLPKELEQERLDCMRTDPDQYNHIWEGDYVSVIDGAYYVEQLKEAEKQGRIGRVARDPHMQIRAIWDIGVADSMTIWIAQYVNREIRVLDYCEGQGQSLGYYLNWLRSNGYENALCVLPHDGAKRDAVSATRFSDHIEEAGFETKTIPNQGKGAAMKRVEAARKRFPMIWFNKDTTKDGRKALGWYHAKKDEARGTDLGPEHDWSSHGCLVGSSLVSTDRGLLPIKDVAVGDYVHTPDGLGLVQWSGEVKRTAETITLMLSDGNQLTMTPEHKVFTTKGVVTADTIEYDDVVFTAKDLSCLKLANAKNIGFRAAFIESFKGTNTGTGLKGGYTLVRKAVVSVYCTAKRLVLGMARSSPLMETGKISLQTTGQSDLKTQGETSRQNMTGKRLTEFVTTKSLSQDITHGDTLRLNTCTERNGLSTTGRYLKDFISTISTAIRQITGSKTLSRSARLNTLSFTLKQIFGLGVKTTSGNLKRLVNWLSQGAKSGEVNALNVTQVSKQLPRQENIAARVVDIKRNTNEVAVYDLTVEKHHCYFANNFLVSNSDAFGLMCVDYEEPLEPKKRNRPKAAQGAWMG
jgi:phage terminase large subunit